MKADSTTTRASNLALPPGEEGLSADVNCPRCEYNWRGLTVPRCPECGYVFDWRDVPCLLEEARNKLTTGEIVWRIVGGVFLTLIAIPLLIYLFPLGIGLVIIAALSALYTIIEFAIASLVMFRYEENWFRRWWEGVVISSAAACVAVALLGIDLERVMRRGRSVVSWEHVWWVTAIFTCAVVIQYVVFKAREKQWGHPVTGRRLLVGIVTAKLVILASCGIFLSLQA